MSLDSNTIAAKDLYEFFNHKSYNVLPVPATYIIGKDGKISYVYYDPDYTKRTFVDEILEM